MIVSFDFRVPAFMRERAAEECGADLPAVLHVTAEIFFGADCWEARIISPAVPWVCDDCGFPLPKAIGERALQLFAQPS